MKKARFIFNDILTLLCGLGCGMAIRNTQYIIAILFGLVVLSLIIKDLKKIDSDSKE